jgi:hypothetical protein
LFFSPTPRPAFLWRLFTRSYTENCLLIKGIRGKKWSNGCRYGFILHNEPVLLTIFRLNFLILTIPKRKGAGSKLDPQRMMYRRAGVGSRENLVESAFAIFNTLGILPPAGMPAVMNPRVFAEQNFQALKRHGCRFRAAQGIEAEPKTFGF